MKLTVTATIKITVAASLLLAACTSSHPRALPGPAPSLSSDWPAYHGDAARTGVSAGMPSVTGNPRVTGSVHLDGAVYASPIVTRGMVIVATEHDSVYALDAAGASRWRTQLGEPSPAGERPCGNIDPLGITGTPVYDPASGSVFVAIELGGPPRHELVALDVQTGEVRWRRGIDLPGVDARAMQQRGALTVTGGQVWVPFGGLDGDCGAYKGRLVGLATDGSGVARSYTVPTTREAGMWAPPGPVLDPAGTMFVSVGNGAAVAGDPYDGSDSVLALNSRAGLDDSFAPKTWASENAADQDLGSQGPALIGKWIFIAGKSGTAYVLARDKLGGIGGQVSSAPVCQSFGGTAVLGDVVYVPCTDGVRAVRIDRAGRMRVLWHAAQAITGSPVVGGGLVWALDTDAGILHGLDPASGHSRSSVRVGAVTRFATPALSGRDVLVPTRAGLTIIATS